MPFFMSLTAAVHTDLFLLFPVCCDLFLVVVFHIGVAGVGIATVISQMVSCSLPVERAHQLRETKLTAALRPVKTDQHQHAGDHLGNHRGDTDTGHAHMENDYQKQIQPGIQHTGNNQEKQRPFRISYCPEEPRLRSYRA